MLHTAAYQAVGNTEQPGVRRMRTAYFGNGATGEAVLILRGANHLNRGCISRVVRSTEPKVRQQLQASGRLIVHITVPV